MMLVNVLTLFFMFVYEKSELVSIFVDTLQLISLHSTYHAGL